MDAADDDQQPNEGGENSNEPKPGVGGPSGLTIHPLIDFSAMTQDLLAPLRASINDAFRLNAPRIDAFEGLQVSLQALAGPLQEKLLASLGNFSELATEALRNHFPANWHSLPLEDLDAAFEVVTTEGIPLAWTPRLDLVEELINAPDEGARRMILAERSKEIADDCAGVLVEVTDRNLAELAEFAAEAASCLSIGKHFSAQAGATTVVDTLLHQMVARGAPFLSEPLKRMRFGRFPDLLDVPDDETALDALRSTCALAPLRAALLSYQFPSLNDPGEPMPTQFNRHTTVHQTCRAHSTAPNAVVAVMLAASLLREAEQAGW
ncbi:hypothetical protein [Spirillospora sp. CA-294931]|uniref:hypothetical protein n=1 Tax=Spirillospora sp. CA-294931 TaxID=3240042 RepID=UPI003D918BF9